MKYDVVDIYLNIYFFHITPSNLDLVLQDKEEKTKKKGEENYSAMRCKQKTKKSICGKRNKVVGRR